MEHGRTAQILSNFNGLFLIIRSSVAIRLDHFQAAGSKLKGMLLYYVYTFSSQVSWQLQYNSKIVDPIVTALQSETAPEAPAIFFRDSLR